MKNKLRILEKSMLLYCTLLALFLGDCSPKVKSVSSPPVSNSQNANPCLLPAANQAKGISPTQLALTELAPIDATKLQMPPPIVESLKYGDQTTLLLYFTPKDSTTDPNYAADYASYSISKSGTNLGLDDAENPTPSITGASGSFLEEIPLDSSYNGQTLIINASSCASLKRRETSEACGKASTVYFYKPKEGNSAIGKVLHNISLTTSELGQVGLDLAQSSQEFLDTYTPSNPPTQSEQLFLTAAKNFTLNPELVNGVFSTDVLDGMLDDIKTSQSHAPNQLTELLDNCGIQNAQTSTDQTTPLDPGTDTTGDDSSLVVGGDNTSGSSSVDVSGDSAQGTTPVTTTSTSDTLTASNTKTGMGGSGVGSSSGTKNTGAVTSNSISNTTSASASSGSPITATQTPSVDTNFPAKDRVAAGTLTALVGAALGVYGIKRIKTRSTMRKMEADERNRINNSTTQEDLELQKQIQNPDAFKHHMTEKFKNYDKPGLKTTIALFIFSSLVIVFGSLIATNVLDTTHLVDTPLSKYSQILETQYYKAMSLKTKLTTLQTQLGNLLYQQGQSQSH